MPRWSEFAIPALIIVDFKPGKQLRVRLRVAPGVKKQQMATLVGFCNPGFDQQRVNNTKRCVINAKPKTPSRSAPGQAVANKG